MWRCFKWNDSSYWFFFLGGVREVSSFVVRRRKGEFGRLGLVVEVSGFRVLGREGRVVVVLVVVDVFEFRVGLVLWDSKGYGGYCEEFEEKYLLGICGDFVKDVWVLVF